MNLARPFDPLEVGESDNFVFDFTGDVGSATVASTTWSCTVASGQDGTDPTASSRIVSTSFPTSIQVRSPTDGSITTRNGAFSMALVGSAPSTMVGSYYVLEASVTLSDARVLKLNALVKVVATGSS